MGVTSFVLFLASGYSVSSTFSCATTVNNLGFLFVRRYMLKNIRFVLVFEVIFAIIIVAYPVKIPQLLLSLTFPSPLACIIIYFTPSNRRCLPVFI